MTDEHPAKAFVREFHADLTAWFSGDSPMDQVWRQLERATHPEMVLVYPSGERLSGAAFLKSIESLHGRSPGFVASVSDIELVYADDDRAVVSYKETQTGARQSAAENQRSALALVVRQGGVWTWRFIQETALPPQ